MPLDHSIPTPDVSIYDLKGMPAGSMVRTYEDVDDRLVLQLRSRGKTDPEESLEHNMLAHASLTQDHVLQLRNVLSQFLRRRRRFTPVGDTSDAGSSINNFKFEVRTDNPQQAYDMAQLMLLVGTLYGVACCVDGAVGHGPWPAPAGECLSPEAQELATALRALFED